MVVGINLISIGSIKGGGTHTYILNIIKSLNYHNIHNCRFIVYKQSQIPKEFFQFPQNIDLIWVEVPNLGNGVRRILFEQTIFYKYLKHSDVLFSHCTSLPLFAKCSKVFVLHDVYFKEYRQRYSRFKTFMLDILTKLHISQSKKIITVSNYSKKSILTHYHVDESKIKIIPNFVIPTEVSPNKKLDIPINTIRKSFLFIGSIQPGKNIIGMVDGFRLFLENDPNYYLIIVGKPAYKGEEIISNIPKDPRIIYLGYQSDENVRYLQKHCFATVLLSFCEGFGIPPLEGFQYFKPALVSNKTSLPEVVGEAGICVDPNDTLAISKGYKKIVTLYKELQSNIPERLRYYDKQRIMEEFYRVLNIS